MKPVVITHQGREAIGMKDCGHFYPKCSNCQKPLADIWVTMENRDMEWRVQATCCYCNDKSYPITVRGLFHYSGYHEVKKDDVEDVIAYTDVIDNKIDLDKSLVTLITRRSNG